MEKLNYIKHVINLKNKADILKKDRSIFTYFLDGSRHTYKVDDISYNKNIYPIVAGQIGIGCCKRVNKVIQKENFTRKLVIALPRMANPEGRQTENVFNELLNTINKESKIKERFGIEFDKVLDYKKEHKDDKFEKKAIARIQDYMIDLEKDAVANLVIQGKLNEDNYLIKDGSLEYKKVSEKVKNSKNLTDKEIINHYKYVIGVSKSFNPLKCLIKGGGSNSDIIANLKPFERTPAYMYQSEISGNNVYFLIWYLRLREARYTKNIFDGVVKVEKLIIKEEEKEKGVDSESIDIISAHLLNERNPTCYGADKRWANHIYPIYLTENFIKSKYLSSKLFMELF